MNDLYRQLIRERFAPRPSWSLDGPRVDPMPQHEAKNIDVPSDDDVTIKRRSRELEAEVAAMNHTEEVA